MTVPLEPSVRPRARLGGPELAGGIASLLVVALVAVTAASGPIVGATPGGTPSIVPSPSATPSPTPSPPVDPAVADLLIVVNQQLIRHGERLEQELARDRFRTAEVSTIVRELNATARYGEDAAPALGSEAAAADIASRLEDAYRALRETATQTLRSSVTNAAAYRRGAQQLVEQLAAIPPLQEELVALKSGPPASPEPASPGPSPSPVPSADVEPTAPPSPSASAPGGPSPSPSDASAPSQLVNGGFEQGVGPPWSLHLGDGAAATIVADEVDPAAGSKAARIDIAAIPTAFSGISVRQGGLRLEAGARYTVRIALRASMARDVRIRVSTLDGEAYLTRVAAAGPAWSNTSITFNAPATDDEAVLEIDLGRSGATTWLDDVSLVLAGPATLP